MFSKEASAGAPPFANLKNKKKEVPNGTSFSIIKKYFANEAASVVLAAAVEGEAQRRETE